MAVDYDFAWRRALNLSGTAIRGSVKDPVMVSGYQYVLTVGEGLNTHKELWFIIENVFDLRSLPGFDAVSTPGENTSQAPFHGSGRKDFKLGRGVCAPPEPTP